MCQAPQVWKKKQNNFCMCMCKYWTFVYWVFNILVFEYFFFFFFTVLQLLWSRLWMNLLYSPRSFAHTFLCISEISQITSHASCLKTKPPFSQNLLYLPPCNKFLNTVELDMRDKREEQWNIWIDISREKKQFLGFNIEIVKM